MMEKNKEADLKKIALAFAENLEFTTSYGYGAPAIDEKRPFGNSNVEGDLLEIIGAKPEGKEDGYDVWSEDQYDYVRNLYCSDLTQFLQKLIKEAIDNPKPSKHE